MFTDAMFFLAQMEKWENIKKRVVFFQVIEIDHVTV